MINIFSVSKISFSFVLIFLEVVGEKGFSVNHFLAIELVVRQPQIALRSDLDILLYTAVVIVGSLAD